MHEFRHQQTCGLVAHLPMTRQHGFRTGDAKGEAQGHHAFTDFHFTRAAVARAQDDQFCSLQI